MALSKGQNSYAEVTEADAYFADRLDAAAWTEASPELKAQALVTATRLLDDLRWTGSALEETQPLAFPRAGQYFDPRIGAFLTFQSDEVPQRVLSAIFELAHHLLENDGVLDSSGGVGSISVGTIRLDGVRKAPRVPAFVTSMVRPLLVNGGSNSWWRAN